MARPFVFLRSLLVAGILQAIFGQDNPFGDDQFVAPPAPPRPPPLQDTFGQDNPFDDDQFVALPAPPRPPPLQDTFGQDNPFDDDHFVAPPAPPRPPPLQDTSGHDNPLGDDHFVAPPAPPRPPPLPPQEKEDLDRRLALAVSDPITVYNGQKTKFWLPYWGKHLLVQTPDLAVSASILQGPRKDLQWFDRFYIRLPDGRQVVEVGVKREVPRNSTWRSRQQLLSQLDIKLGGSQESLRERKNHAFESPDGQVKVAVGFRRHDTPRLRGDPITEYVNIETKSITFLLIASHAGNEFPDDVEMQNKYVHLDWITREMIGTKSFTGILPQIWGVQKPMTEEVASMLKSPAEAFPICAEA